MATAIEFRIQTIKGIPLIGLYCLAALCLSAAQDITSSATPERCRVDKDQPPQQVFADIEGKNSWREYRAPKDVPQLQLDGGESAQLWQEHGGGLLIRTIEPGQDYWAYTDYCFNAAGHLEQVRFELRTAWGWGYRQEGPGSSDVRLAHMSKFFDIATGKTIAKPPQADDVPDAMKPHLYSDKSKLPFAKLLHQ